MLVLHLTPEELKRDAFLHLPQGQLLLLFAYGGLAVVSALLAYNHVLAQQQQALKQRHDQQLQLLAKFY